MRGEQQRAHGEKCTDSTVYYVLSASQAVRRYIESQGSRVVERTVHVPLASLARTYLYRLVIASMIV
jgi:hypothetical protein